MTQSALDEIHTHMQAELAQHDAAFAGIYACTCLEADPDCTCRKPSAEMIFQAVREHDLDLSQSWLAGDHDRDIQMAINAGVPHTVRICGEKAVEVDAEFELREPGQLKALLQRLWK